MNKIMCVKVNGVEHSRETNEEEASRGYTGKNKNQWNWCGEVIQGMGIEL